MKKKRYTSIFIICAALLCIGVSLGINLYVSFLVPNVISDGGTIYIYKNMDYEQMMKDVIEESGALKNFSRFSRVAKKMELSKKIKPGMYKLNPDMTNYAIVNLIASGMQTPIKLVVPGYLRNKEKLASVLGKKLEADSLNFITVLNDSTLRKKLGFKDETYLSMIIPNTYEVYWTITPEQLLERLKKEYDKFWNQERTANAKALNMTKEEVSILASIVIEESKYIPELPTIAGVYINRLKRGMPLQADPTVKFAINDTSVKRILNKHLRIDSPYNTYKYKGLPPGPITIPPISAINAVLNYEKHNYIYFCANSTFDGQHSFASNYRDHLKNARKYQKALKSYQKSQTNSQ